MPNLETTRDVEEEEEEGMGWQRSEPRDKSPPGEREEEMHVPVSVDWRFRGDSSRWWFVCSSSSYCRSKKFVRRADAGFVKDDETRSATRSLVVHDVCLVRFMMIILIILIIPLAR